MQTEEIKDSVKLITVLKTKTNIKFADLCISKQITNLKQKMH